MKVRKTNMRRKSKEKEVFTFSSLSSPNELLLKIKAEAVKSKLDFAQTENGFDLELKSNHGGKVVYRANVSANEDGGSDIEGIIETIPWHTRPAKKETLWDKILTVFAYILSIPIALIACLAAAITYLVIRIIHGKSEEIHAEEILFDFMTNKMCCTRENNQ